MVAHAGSFGSRSFCLLREPRSSKPDQRARNREARSLARAGRRRSACFTDAPVRPRWPSRCSPSALACARCPCLRRSPPAGTYCSWIVGWLGLRRSSLRQAPSSVEQSTFPHMWRPMQLLGANANILCMKAGDDRGQPQTFLADTVANLGWVGTEVAVEAVRVGPRTIRRCIELGELEAKPQCEGANRARLVSVDGLHELRFSRPTDGDGPVDAAAATFAGVL